MISTQSETIKIKDKIGYTKKIYIPENLEYGRYILYVKVNYDGKIGSASSGFNVGRVPWSKEKIILYIILGSLIIGIIILIIEIYKIKGIMKRHGIGPYTLVRYRLVKNKK